MHDEGLPLFEVDGPSGWFGPRAGQPGTAFQIRFRAAPSRLWGEPVESEVIELASRRKIVAYPDLRAAAGHVGREVEPPADELVPLPIADADPDLFAVRVSGTSTDGGKQPLHDGDWAVMRLARSLPSSAVEGRVVPVQVEGDAHGAGYQIKRLKREGRGSRLISDNPAGPAFTATEQWCRARGSSARSSRKSQRHHWGRCGRIRSREAVRSRRAPPRSDRHAGHLFVFVDQTDVLVEPDLVRFAGVTPRPEPARWIRRGERRARIVGLARDGGLRIDGGPDGFAERTGSHRSGVGDRGSR